MLRLDTICDYCARMNVVGRSFECPYCAYYIEYILDCSIVYFQLSFSLQRNAVDSFGSYNIVEYSIDVILLWISIGENRNFFQIWNIFDNNISNKYRMWKKSDNFALREKDKVWKIKLFSVLTSIRIKQNTSAKIIWIIYMTLCSVLFKITRTTYNL